ncbi:PREDICTED: disease resistance protein RPP13-like [Ipomoea nil]|uniref:disease resistance protein RPP13-like n=1 Tax=Ipomoea nil TaxID=35883 RepID=UPI000901F9B8|nr:PREDICTED: disease resistance protein RPP13-like [Ipomoea nil]
MLLGLLNSNGYVNSSTRDDDLALRLYQSMKHQRYLIVIDDLWSMNAWDAINRCFPDDKHGSRVLLTTLLEKAAYYVSSNIDSIHQMHFLDQSESWDLFCQKAGTSRRANFETIARPIVDKCKGLPFQRGPK